MLLSVVYLLGDDSVLRCHWQVACMRCEIKRRFPAHEMQLVGAWAAWSHCCGRVLVCNNVMGIMHGCHRKP